MSQSIGENFVEVFKPLIYQKELNKGLLLLALPGKFPSTVSIDITVSRSGLNIQIGLGFNTLVSAIFLSLESSVI